MAPSSTPETKENSEKADKKSALREGLEFTGFLSYALLEAGFTYLAPPALIVVPLCSIGYIVPNLIPVVCGAFICGVTGAFLGAVGMDIVNPESRDDIMDNGDSVMDRFIFSCGVWSALAGGAVAPHVLKPRQQSPAAEIQTDVPIVIDFQELGSDVTVPNDPRTVVMTRQMMMAPL